MTNYYLGFDLGGTSLKSGFGNSSEGIISFQTYPLANKTINNLKKTFLLALNDIVRKSKLSKTPNRLLAVGLATPGIINHDTGLILGSSPNLPCLQNMNLKDLVADITQLPVWTDNDANLMTLAEAKHCSSHSVLGITVGTGIGTGFVVDHQIFHGEHFRALEAGHTIVVPQGRQCLCGKKGCLEAYCSAESIKNLVYESHPELVNLSLSDIFQHLGGNVQSIVNNTLSIFGIGIANLIMILNPGTVVIGGGVTEITFYNFPLLTEKITSSLTEAFKDVLIKKAKFGNQAGVLGGIYLAESSM